MSFRHRSEQRGAATVVLTMLLLFGTLIVVLALNRGLIFEQRTSVNQLRATSAREAAEAGIEWATGMLNAPYTIESSDCAFNSTATNSFRSQYVQTQLQAATPSTNLAPATNAYPGCDISATNKLSCSCPAAPSNPATKVVASLGSTVPKFTVQFLALDDSSVKLRSTGCLPTSGSCGPNDAGSTARTDAKAVVEVILKLRPIIRAVPTAPVSAGGQVDLSGSVNLVNKDITTNGILVNAGSTISVGNGVTLSSIPGTPTANALIGADESLSTLSSADPNCSNSTVFIAYFGSTIAQYVSEPTTKSLSCSGASNCANQLMNAYNDGWRSFYLDSDMEFSGNYTIGSEVQPITIVTQKSIKVNGDVNVYGLIFSNSADWNSSGTGSANIYGAELTCKDLKVNGNGTITYHAKVLNNLKKINAAFVRVPGSWRDQ